jgi:hypothetical protein
MIRTLVFPIALAATILGLGLWPVASWVGGPAQARMMQPADPGDDDNDDNDDADAVPDPDDQAGTDNGDGTDDAADAGDAAAGDGGAGDSGDDGAAAAAGDSDDDDSTAAGAGTGDDDDGAAAGTGAGDDGDDDGAAAAAGGSDDDDNTGNASNRDDDGDDGSADDRDDQSPGGGAGADDDDADDADDRDDQRADDADPLRYVGVEDARTRSKLDRAEGIDSDDEGFRYRRGEVVALGVDAAAIVRLQQAGFRLIERHRLTALGSDAVLLAAPARIRDVDALVQVDGLIGSASHGFNHLYDRSATLVRSAGKAQRPQRRACACRIGVIDTGVAGTLPDLKRTRLLQRAFNGGQPDPALHGTVISSIIAGTQPAAAGSRTEIMVGDVFSGARSTAGSALALVRALDWLAAQKVAVINVSLSGPANPVVADAINRLVARGHVIVAAAGNDGPAAPPAFPAAYSGVVAVTAVDEKLGVYRYANRGSYIAFAAKGVDVMGLGPDGSVRIVSGTSFAAPAVAIRLASAIKLPDPAVARSALAALTAEARDLGAPGRDPVFGAGLIGDRQ